MDTLRLKCSAFYVDLRIAEIRGRWLASADTPDGVSLGTGVSAREAILEALVPFDGLVGELLASAPPELQQLRIE